jgi:hypothetical protein
MRLASLTRSDQERGGISLGPDLASEVRADLIRQLHERPDGQEMADLLIFLEEWEWARQTVVLNAAVDAPAVLVVGFRLRWVRGWAHTVFRAESLLNTPLFVGFPGFVSKLWLAHDENGVDRGVYQWTIGNVPTVTFEPFGGCWRW